MLKIKNNIDLRKLRKYDFRFKYIHIMSELAKLEEENERLRTRITTIKRLRKKQTQKKNKYK